MKFYLNEIESVYKELDTQKEGLSSEEAKKRLERDGKNKLDEGKKTPLWKNNRLQSFFRPIKRYCNFIGRGRND